MFWLWLLRTVRRWTDSLSEVKRGVWNLRAEVILWSLFAVFSFNGFLEVALPEFADKHPSALGLYDLGVAVFGGPLLTVARRFLWTEFRRAPK